MGERVRDDVEVSDHVPNYDDVLLWYDDLSAAVQEKIRAVDWAPVLGETPIFEVTSRAKTIDTLREKLQRDHSTPLPSIQDVAGVRFEADMVLSQQDAVALAIAHAFDHDETAIRDIRADPHSGYRAVHVWLRLPAGRVEVQIRTHLQGRWANMYEAVADTYGRRVRYGELPDDEDAAGLVETVQEFSLTRVASLERMLDQIHELEQEFEEQRPAFEHLRSQDSEEAREVVRRHTENRARVAKLRQGCQEDSAEYTSMFQTLESLLRGAK